MWYNNITNKTGSGCSVIFTEIIEKKRDGKELSFREIKRSVDGYISGKIPDYQMSALLMAIFFNGMNSSELSALTEIMAHSGDMIDLSKFGEITVDKHSSGGVGDKTTLVVAPIVASLGCKVAKMSGKGLGFTGGTYDKLCSIPGYKITPSNEEFLSIVDHVGVSIVGQNDKLVPADKKLYALRDVTGTVESIPLIASSIMSKKIAAGAKNIVLDVKFGSGAFMKSADDAKTLAETMVNIGKNCGRNTAAVISNMNKPLGFAVGNSLEVIEAVNLLKGADIPDLYTECVTISALMLSLCNNISYEDAVLRVKEAISSGTAYDKFKEWISAQGGDVSYIENTDKFINAKFSLDVIADNTGYIGDMDTKTIGKISCMLGAGRSELGDAIDYSAGIYIYKKTGDKIEAGEKLCTLYTNKKDITENASELYRKAIKVCDDIPSQTDKIISIIR